jgi:hypothetical protein
MPRPEDAMEFRNGFKRRPLTAAPEVYIGEAVQDNLELSF